MAREKAPSPQIEMLLCLFLGFTGAHRFYAGKILTGFLYLFTGGFCVIGWLVDSFLLIRRNFKNVVDSPAPLPVKPTNPKKKPYGAIDAPPSAKITLDPEIFSAPDATASANTKSSKQSIPSPATSTQDGIDIISDSSSISISISPELIAKLDSISTKRSTATDFPPSNYIVFDIETTGFSRTNDRIIEIAADEYLDGVLIHQYHTYINPGFHIPIRASRINGIRDRDVKDAPSIHEVKDAILSFFGSKPLVGHNIDSFDIPFLEEQFGIPIRNKTIDTLDLARRVFPGLPSYKLPYLNQVFELGDVEHHRAGNDIIVNHALFLACCSPKEYRHFTLDRARLSAIPIKSSAPNDLKIDIHSIVPSDPNNIPNTALTGKCIAFSGDLLMTRKQAMQIAVDAGAILKSSVSKKVSYLVDGEHDSCFETPSKKVLRAKELIEENSCDIQIIDEDTFLELAKPLP